MASQFPEAIVGYGGTADIVFVIDASSSMEPCIEGVKNHISKFVDVFKDDPNGAWDLRLDFLAHRDALREARDAGVDKDFRERVESAGGLYDDVDVRISLLWEDRNDLDLHVITPSGEEIYFADKESSCGGVLDVDRNVSGETTRPVENIRWRRGTAPAGTYRVFVQNFGYHESRARPVRYKAEVYNNGVSKTYRGVVSQSGETGDESDRTICTFTFDPNARPSPAEEGEFEARSVHEEKALSALYGSSQGRFFTSDVAAFQRALSTVRASENESPVLALDCALDFPWRDRSGCHRIVALFSDEPVEGGNRQEESLRLIPALIEKLHTLKVMLFLVTPDSEGFEHLAAADLCDWILVEGGDGLRSVDFATMLERIGKTISKSQTPLGAPPPVARRALFGQDRW